MKHVLLVFSIFFFSHFTNLQAHEVVSDASDILSCCRAPLANIDGESSALVHGCVNVITGDFLDGQTDLELAGGSPLTLQRYYCSSDQSLGSLFHGWHHNLWGVLSQQFSSRHNYAVTKGVGGGQYVFKERVKKDKRSFGYYDLSIDPEMLRKGLTNCGSGLISAQTNIKNALMSSEKGGKIKKGAPNLVDYRWSRSKMLLWVKEGIK